MRPVTIGGRGLILGAGPGVGDTFAPALLARNGVDPESSRLFCWQTRAMSFIAINPATEEVVAEFDGHTTPTGRARPRAPRHAAFQSWKITSDRRTGRADEPRAAELLESEIPVVGRADDERDGQDLRRRQGRGREVRA